METIVLGMALKEGMQIISTHRNLFLSINNLHRGHMLITESERQKLFLLVVNWFIKNIA